jgi:hypothetical protein
MRLHGGQMTPPAITRLLESCPDRGAGVRRIVVFVPPG